MGTALLVTYFHQLPEEVIQGRGAQTTASQEGEISGGTMGKARRRAALHIFQQQVQKRYTEGTLLRLLHGADGEIRRAAAFALGLIGTMQSCAALASCLHDDDELVPHLAADSLWSVWFRGDDPSTSDELYKLVRTRDRQLQLNGLNQLIEKAPGFAEAYNQRAIYYFRQRQFDRAAADCERVLRLNPHHFGAQAGLGQCLLQMRRNRAALKAFRAALRLNPYLESIEEAVRTLEKTLGDEGR